MSQQAERSEGGEGDRGLDGQLQGGDDGPRPDQPRLRPGVCQVGHCKARTSAGYNDQACSNFAICVQVLINNAGMVAGSTSQDPPPSHLSSDGLEIVTQV